MVKKALHRYRAEPLSLGAILDTKPSWFPRQEENMAIERWEDFLPRQLREHTRLYRREHTTLWLEVDNSAWAQELHIAIPAIIAGLNRLAQRKIVTDIRIRVTGSPVRK